MNRKIFK